VDLFQLYILPIILYIKIGNNMIGIADLPVGLILFAYAILVFIDSSKWFKSQANDILDVNVALTKGHTVRNIFEHEVTSKSTKKTYKLKQIIKAANQANGFLRYLGFLPLFLLVFGVLFGMGIESDIFNNNTMNPMICKYFTYCSIVILIFYTCYKFYLKIPIFLIELHPSYTNKSILKVLMNIYPLW